MRKTWQMTLLVLKTVLRDRLLLAIGVTGIAISCSIPVFSLFSMRQVQELSITLSLSAISFVLLVVTLLLGASSLWRDIDRRFTTALLGLPLPRSSYVLGKFFGISIVIVSCALLLGIVSLGVIAYSSTLYVSDLPILWWNVIAAIIADICKYLMLLAVALLISTVSTSQYLPFFSALAVYIAGSASQEVSEYVAGEYGATMSPFVRLITKWLYYVIPNFSTYNLKVYAIYSLPLPIQGLMWSAVYFIIYLGILLICAVWSFERREMQ
jgi:Cu-processing system permease protein